MKKITIAISLFLTVIALGKIYTLFALPDTSNRLGRSLIIAAHEGDLNLVKQLLDNDADINFEDIDGLTPLISAVLENKLEVVKELLIRNVDINLIGFEQCTALCFAAERIDASIFTLLVNAGADVNTTHNMSPLHRAAYVNNGNIIRQLLDLGANPNMKALCGSNLMETPLELAIRINEKDAIIALIAHVTYEDIKPILATILSLKQLWGNGTGRDVGKKHVVPKIIKYIVEQKVAAIKQYVPSADESSLATEIKANIYKVLNKRTEATDQGNAQPVHIVEDERTKPTSLDETLGSFAS